MASNSSPKNPFKVAEASTGSEKLATKIVAPDTASPFKAAESTPFKISEDTASKSPDVNPQGSATPAMPASSASENDSSSTTEQSDTSVSAMCLRAIYGITENPDTQGLIEKANTLDGVKNLTQISLAEAQAIELIKTQQFGLAQCDSINISVDNGDLNFITVNDTHLAVITESGFQPGVRETITLTAERISEIS